MDDSTSPKIASTERRREGVVLLVLVFLKLGIHLALATRYGRHGDEYYFIDCGKHLAFGYVDHAPLVPWLAGLSTMFFGDSLVTLRLPSILAGAAVMWLTIVLARRFGANAFGQALAGIALLLAPAYLRMHGMLDIVAFEPLFWTVAALLVADIIDGADGRRWLLVGAVAGLGLLNKHTMLLWGLGMGVGMLTTPFRAQLKTPWPWLGAAVAMVIVSPNLAWQAANDWPTVEFVRVMGETVLADIPRHLFLAGQLLYFGILAAPIWLAGVVYFFTDAGKRYRVFGVLFVTVMVVLTVTHAKPYYSAPAFPLVFAGGGAVLGRWFESRRASLAAYTVALVGSSLVLALVTLPLLPLSTVDAALEKTLGWVVPPVALTHDMHSEFGWPEQAELVAEVFETLTPEERETATIFAGKYNEASALNLHGKAYGLPRATSGHMTHYLWGPDEARPGPVVLVGASDKALATICDAPEEVARIRHQVAMEADVPIYVCREHAPLRDVWAQLKRYRHGDER
jgi:4-amino-4-deoxy-L-arabinose transferase-like glycosyltransferase